MGYDGVCLFGVSLWFIQMGNISLIPFSSSFYFLGNSSPVSNISQSGFNYLTAEWICLGECPAAQYFNYPDCLSCPTGCIQCKDPLAC